MASNRFLPSQTRAINGLILRMFLFGFNTTLIEVVLLIQKQREARKKYRKAKRKAWIRRKMNVGPAPVPNSQLEEKKAPIDVTQVDHSEDEKGREVGNDTLKNEEVPIRRKRCPDNPVPVPNSIKRAKTTSKTKSARSRITPKPTSERILRSTTRARLSIES